ncbi:hypothetical protein EXE10_10755 [Acinetobacter sp. WCHAc060033]|uniref:hypothetical protein n=1 Tax=Acinetobacter sp. WCHAc060033 TaxID=2518624 RepID=UPI0010237AFD|nr:hypothetical protein [Acinetobacter sp. WCHAc060033]RZG83633.1 hypothetical protein EXE10_10755 [Acinetobacter sp. WCHAc060033]
MRKQYHFRQVGDDTCIWDVYRLVELSQNVPTIEILLTEIRELNESYWFPDIYPTTQQIIDHIQLVQDADLKYPIIVCAEGRVMDGMHRVAKAKLQGQLTIQAVKFEVTPQPDFINVDADDLNYDDE